MLFQLLHEPRCFRTGIRTMCVNSREPWEPQYRRRCGKSHFRGWPLGLWPVWRVSSRDTTLSSQRTTRCHRRAGPEQKHRIIDHVRIKYNKECALKWQVPKGKIFVSPKFQEKRSFHNPEIYEDSRRAASTASNANLACDLSCLVVEHTHECKCSKK